MREYYDNQVDPSDDTNMIYDDNKHRYRLTIDAIDKEFNVSFVQFAGSKDNANQLIREFSADMYKFIYKYNRRDIDKRKADEHKLAKNGDIRETILETMLDMVRATIRNGYTLDKDLSWVNPESGVVMDLSNIPSIAPDAMDGLFAYGILHKGPYSYKISAEDYRSGY
jgi:hypothetical protein